MSVENFSDFLRLTKLIFQPGRECDQTKNPRRGRTKTTTKGTGDDMVYDDTLSIKPLSLIIRIVFRYHEGPDALRVSRFWIANYSLPRAKERLENARSLLELPSATRAGRMVELQKKIQSLALECSQVGDTRPISNCCFNDTSSLLLTSSWYVR